MRARWKLLPVVVLWAGRAVADVAGGGNPHTDCFAVFHGITAKPVETKRGRKGPVVVECRDGDATCDADGQAQGSCEFALEVCANEPGIAGCTPMGVKKFRPRAFPLPLPPTGVTEPTCGEPATVVVPIEKPRRLKLVALATATKR